MQTLWFWLVSILVAGYVVMDGFDLGAGSLHLAVAKEDKERRQVLAAIGPLWDGNEVWLLAAGGSLFLAFPAVLAAGFSGLYLAMWLLVWSLMLRGISIEFRSHVTDKLWRAFWDGLFFLTSAVLPVLFGAALGNVIRGVPLGADGWFELPFFTTFATTGALGILDWYTALVGLFAFVAIAGHGALFLGWKTDGPVQARALARAKLLWAALPILWMALTFATREVNPDLLAALPHRPLGLLALGFALAGLGAIFFGLRRERHLLAFLGSSAFLLGLLAATAACLFPVMLRSTVDLAYSLTALNASADPHGLATALKWWFLGFPLALGYLALIFRLHRGKAKAAADGEGY
ncbi:MAG TPA: cytochrome d ubiquinol oxidase subunit II [Holophagaceae bacterium]|nr:cytochrome d ubiquinol oxidase subunit II [Holophagaceae bacterium]